MIKSNLWTILYFCFPVLFCCFAAIFFGKDVNFDAINYHGYAAFALMEGRLETDFFPAGPQSYLNPMGYVPFYFLTLWFGDTGVSLGLAILHSACIYGVIFFARILIDTKRNSLAYHFSIILSLMTVVFWQNVGSSFVDAYVCALVIFGLVFLLRWVDSGIANTKALGVSAFLFGVAVGLKLTSVIFSVSAAIIVFYCAFFKHGSWRGFFVFAFLGVLGFLIIQGWWAYLVYEKTGNPFFPYFNSIFKSTFLPFESIINTRFIPESFIDGLIFPLKAVLPLPWLYQELRAPDIRWIFFFFSLVVVSVGVWKRVVFVNKAGRTAVIFFVVSYVLWLFSSGNGRYAMPIFLLVGVLNVWLLSLFVKEKLLKSVLFLLIFFQAALIYVGGNPRWSEESFSGDWFDYNIPPKLIDEPALYLTIDHNSYSFLASKVNFSSVFVNVSGQISLPYSPDLHRFFQRSMTRVNGNVRVITSALLSADPLLVHGSLPVFNGYSLRPRLIYVLNSRLSRFGFEVDDKDCLFIAPNNNDAFTSTNGLLVSCGLHRSSAALEEYNNAVKEVDIVFNAIENTCYDYFSPRSAVTEKHGDLFMRNYVGSEIKMYLSTGVVWISFSDRIGVKNMGLFEKLLAGDLAIDCHNDLVRVSEDIY